MAAAGPGGRQIVGDRQDLCRLHTAHVCGFQALLEEEGRCTFAGGPGGAKLHEATRAVLAGLARLSGLLAPGPDPRTAPPSQVEIMVQTLVVCLQGLAAMAATVQVLQSAALSEGTWTNPQPAHMATTRLCLQGHRLYQRLTEAGRDLMKSGLRIQWGGDRAQASMNQLLAAGYDEKLGALEARLASLHATAKAVVHGLGGGLTLLSFPAAWETGPKPGSPKPH